VDVVLDYLWGSPAEAILAAASAATRRLRFVNIGSLAGLNIQLPAGPLRSSALELMGSGLGSVSNERLVQVVGKVINAIEPAGLKIDAEAVPLAEVEQTWGRNAGERIVFTL
jgi:hypothetical protein